MLQRPPHGEACNALLAAAAGFSRQSSSFSSISVSSQSSSSSSPFLGISRGHSRSWGSQESCRIAEECSGVQEVTGEGRSQGDHVRHRSSNEREEAKIIAKELEGHTQQNSSSSSSSSREGAAGGQEPAACMVNCQQLAPGVWFAAADLRHAEGMAQACVGADVVYHSASAGKVDTLAQRSRDSPPSRSCRKKMHMGIWRLTGNIRLQNLAVRSNFVFTSTPGGN
eukprot:1149493-Pelagomonas_calceolata.AAC.2